MVHSPRIVLNTLARTFAIGVASGLRSQMPVAAVAWQRADGGLKRGNGPVWSALDSPATRWIATALAVGEVVGDKLPMTPNRIDGAAKYGRIGIGAIAASLVASGLGARSGGLLIAALSGALGATAGTYGGFHARQGVKTQYDLPDLPVALIEDITALTIARLAVARKL